jgi:uncharacterized protein
MLIKRTIQKELGELMQQYPVVTITGPRQSGKTTLAKMTYPDYHYCNLENPEIRKLATEDPNAFFKQFPSPLILDEIQRVPSLLSYIQGYVDEKQEPGQYLITGSQHLSISEAITQSLAGRTALLTLLPLSMEELINAGFDIERDKIIYTGGLPRIYDNDLNPYKANRNYFQTYVERDLNQLSTIRDLSNFERFMRLLAGRIGQILNVSSLSNDLGVSSTTLAEWISILEASFLVFRIYPYYENFGKRLIKSPKIYFSDTGLVSYLLGIETPEQVSRDPLIGNLFENLVVLEAFKTRLNKGLDPNLYYFRDNNGNEVDLVYQRHQELIPVEIKAAMTYHEKLAKGIAFFQRTTQKATKGVVIYAGKMEFDQSHVAFVNFKETWKVF